MYLAQLDKTKRRLFLDLSIHAALADGVFEQEQKNIVDAYRNEMGLEPGDYVAKKDLTTVLNELRNTCTPLEANIVLIEITALIMSDSICDTLEQAFMKKLQEALGASDDKVEKTLIAINQLLKAYSMLEELLQQ